MAKGALWAPFQSPGRTRTCDLQFLTPALYPAELRKVSNLKIVISTLDFKIRRPVLNVRFDTVCLNGRPENSLSSISAKLKRFCPEQ